MNKDNKEKLAEVFALCAAVQDERTEWGDTWDEISDILAAMNPVVHANGSTASWCADMAVLKVKRFYESSCTSLDSLKDAINYLAFSYIAANRAERCKTAINTHAERDYECSER